ncbi:MAG: flagellar biosynthesis protein FlhF [Lachnospiraceae bacterium]|nr:flagellar biosynthesis protein FlhF [Lachnospiraceae bacterium]
MLIKKYVADTETDAIMLAKKELGNDAVVMNIKKIQPRGIMRLFLKPRVEVTAAIDDNLAAEPSAKKVESGRMKADDNPNPLMPNSNTLDALEQAMKSGELNVGRKGRKTEKKKEEKPVINDEVRNLEKKLESMNNSLQNLIENRIKSELEKETELDENSENGEEESEADRELREKLQKLDACRELIYEQLVNAEVTSEYARELVDEIEDMISPDTTINAVLSFIYQKIVLRLGQPRLIYSEDERNPKYSFFIGPTGVGKTTTIAKIVSDLKLNKKVSVAMITADTYRIAAVEQLRTYANILGVPLKVVYSSEEIEEAVREFDNFDYVLIDTAGRSHLNIEQQKDLKELLDKIEDKEVYLTLSITTKYMDLLELIGIYNKITDYNIIFTKLDETKCIGNIYNVRRNTGARLSYVTNGQNVPDDFSKIDTQYIAKKLLGGKVDGPG